MSAAAANRVLAGLVDGRMLVKRRMAGHRLDRKSCPHRAAKRPPLTNMSGGLPLPIKHQYCLYRSSHRKYCLCPHSAAGACPELAPEETPSQAFLSLLPMTIKPQDARCSKTALYFEAGTPMPLAVTTAGYVWSSVSICVGYQTVSFPSVSYPEACFQMDTAKPPFCVYVRSKGTVVVTSS